MVASLFRFLLVDEKQDWQTIDVNNMMVVKFQSVDIIFALSWFTRAI